MQGCPFCGVQAIRYTNDGNVALFLHRAGCFFASPLFDEPFLITKVNWDKWNKRSEQTLAADHKDAE